MALLLGLAVKSFCGWDWQSRRAVRGRWRCCSRPVMSRRATSRHVMSCHVMPCCVMSCPSCRVVSCRAAFCHGCHLDSRTVTFPSSSPHLLMTCVDTTRAFFTDHSHSSVFHPRLTISTSHVGLSGPISNVITTLIDLSFIIIITIIMNYSISSSFWFKWLSSHNE